MRKTGLSLRSGTVGGVPGSGGGPGGITGEGGTFGIGGGVATIGGSLVVGTGGGTSGGIGAGIAEVIACLTGAPQFGQAIADVLTSCPHSKHFVSAILHLSPAAVKQR